MKHTDITEIFRNASAYIGKNTVICGWVRTSRDSKNTAFLEVSDGTSFRHMQVVIDKGAVADYGQFLPLCTAVRVEGLCVKGAGGVEIQANAVTLIGACPPEYPIQKKPHSLEFLRAVPHLRARTNTFSAMFRIRSGLCAAIHKYFSERNYTYVHTPVITGSDCEGAGEIFRLTPADFFGRQAGLTVSGQLEGEAMAMAFGKIYTFGPTFRAENSNTARHAAEFWQVEPEVAFADLHDIMDIAEEMIRYIVKYVLENCAEETAFFEARYEKGLIGKLLNVAEGGFCRLEYRDAIQLLKDSRRDFRYPAEWGLDLQTEHERYLAEEVYKKPLFVVNYPIGLKPFYMKQNPDGITAASTDLLVPGVGEIIGCSERETDYGKLLAAMRARGMNAGDYEQYLDLRKFGPVPHSGFGLGLERMLMYLTGVGNIRDTIPYARAKGDLM